MAPNAIRLCFCPRYHQRSPLPAVARLDHRSVLVDLNAYSPDLEGLKSGIHHSLLHDHGVRMDLEPLDLEFHDQENPDCLAPNTCIDANRLQVQKYLCAKPPAIDPDDHAKLVHVHASNRSRSKNGRSQRTPALLTWMKTGDASTGPRTGANTNGSQGTSTSTGKKRNDKGKGRQERSEGDGDYEQHEGKKGAGDKSSRSEGGAAGPRYVFARLCGPRHGEDTSNKLLPEKEFWARIDPPHCQSIQDVLAKLVQKIKSYQPDLQFGSRGFVKARLHRHSFDQCHQSLSFQELRHGYTQSTTDLNNLQRSQKLVMMHLQGLNTFLSAQREQAALKNGSLGNEPAKIPESQEQSNTDQVADDAGDDETRHWLMVRLCPKKHKNTAISKLLFRIGIRPSSIQSLQDIAIALESEIQQHNPDYFFDPERHTARFHHYFDRDCQSALSLDEVLDKYTWSRLPESQLEILEAEKALKMDIEGTPDLIDNQEEELSANGGNDSLADGNIEDNGPQQTEEVEEEMEEAADGNGRFSKKRASSDPATSQSKRLRGEADDPDERDEADDTDERDAENLESEGSEQVDEDDEAALSSEVESEDKGSEHGSDSPDNSNEPQDGEENATHGELALSAVPYTKLERRRLVRVGLWKTDDSMRRPGPRILPMRSVVVAMVNTVDNTRRVEEFLVVDSWKVMGRRVGDYPCADVEKTISKRSRVFTPDNYWRAAHKRGHLKAAVVEYLDDLDQDQAQRPVADSDSVVSNDIFRRRAQIRRPDVVLEAPWRPRHRSRDIFVDWIAPWQIVWAPHARIDAVICIANELTEKVSLETRRNWQASLPPTQTLTAFRRYVKNANVHDGHGTLKHVLRRNDFEWFGDFQVWIMPFHRLGNGAANEAYCWDQHNHPTLTIGDFLHRDELTRFGYAQLFIEIRILQDPRHERMVRAWRRHGERYRTGRTSIYGWKTQKTGPGRCVLDDDEDEGHIRNDNASKTLPPRRT